MPALALITQSIQVPDRAAQWGEWMHRIFGGLQSDVYGDDSFSGDLCAYEFGRVKLVRLAASRHRVFKSATAAFDCGEECIKIVAPLRGSAVVHQLDRQSNVHVGAWMAYDTTQSYRVDNPGACEHLIAVVPKANVVERGMAWQNALVSPIAAQGVARAALEAMRQAYRNGPSMTEAALEAAGAQIEQLVRLSLRDVLGHADASTQNLALYDRIRTHIAQHLSDPNLSADSIAVAFNCSRRSLYYAFEGQGESITPYIQRQRLEACVRDLQDAKRPGLRVTDVAMSWGFTNLSHFSRAFKDKTGASPTEFRNALRH